MIKLFWIQIKSAIFQFLMVAEQYGDSQVSR